MSKTVDERVVSMQFDNKNFESNVRTSISTLDKLKEKLNFSGAAKSFDNLNAATKKVDMSHLGSAVETVRARFSAMEVVGVTALVNIANQAVNAGKRLVSSLTVDPIMDGFKEYELTLNAVQTTMAATGLSAKEVEKELKKLDEYADKTVYSTADMINNLSKFTNAGVDLEIATDAMVGIANAVALAGGGASQAASAFYNLGQAIGTGYLTRVDYNSLNNVANMTTMKWKESMVEAALAAGTLTQVGEDAYQAGSKTLSLQQLFIDGLQEQWATTDVMLTVLSEYSNEETELGKQAYEAATNVKTFTQMMESLKATAGTGWKDTWQLIFGDIDAAKKFWTGITNFVSNIITKIADIRNDFLEGVLGTAQPFSKLSDKLEKLNKAAKPTVKTLEELNKVADRVIRGDFGNQWDFGDPQYRAKKLAEAGYDYAKVQNLVNEKLGINVRLTEDSKEAQAELQKEQGKSIEQLLEMSDAQLKKTGFTKDEIKTLRDLQDESKKTGKSISKLLNEMSNVTGRDLLIQSFENLGAAIKKPFDAIKEAWTNIFGKVDEEKLYTKVYDIIVKIEEFTEKLIMSDEAAVNLKNTFEGIFALFQLSHSIFSMSVMGSLKIFNAVLELFDMNILDLAGHIGDYIVKFRDWVKANTIFIGHNDKIAKAIQAVIDGIRKCVKTFKELEPVQKIIKNITEYIDNFFGSIDAGLGTFGIDNIVDVITDAFNRLNDWIKGLNKSENIGEDIIKGLIEGLKKGGKWVVDAIINLGSLLFNTFTSFFDINSPSKVFIMLGGFIIAGLVIGLMKGAPEVWEAIKAIGEGTLEQFKAVDWKSIPNEVMKYVKQVDWSAVFAGALGVGMLFMAKRMLDVVEMFAKPVKQLGKMFDSVGGFFKALETKVKGQALDNTAKAILNIAIAIGILAASIFILTKVDQYKMANALVAIGILAAIVGVLALVAGKLGKIGDFSFGKTTVAVMGIAGALLLMAFTLKKLSEINVRNIPTILKALGAMVLSLAAIFTAMGIFVKGKLAKSIDKAGITILKMAGALLIITFAIKAIAKLSEGDINKGVGVIVALSAIFMAFVAVSKYAGKHAAKAGSMLLAMSGAFLIMVGVIKLISFLNGREVARGLGVVILIGAVFAALVAVTDKAGKDALKAGGMLLMMSTALLIMTVVIQQLSKITDTAGLLKAVGIIAIMGAIFAALIAVTDKAGEHAVKAGIMLMMIAGAFLILTVVLFLLKSIAKNGEGLAAALGIITVLGLLFAGLIAVTKNVPEKCVGALATIIIAIALLVVAVAALSMIDDTKQVVTVAAALSVLMGAFAAIIATAGKLQGVTNIIKPLAMMVGVVAALAGIVALLTLIPNANSVLTTATALALLLNAMATALLILDNVRSSMSNLADNVTVLSLMSFIVMELAGVLGIMSYLNVEASIPSAIALGILLNAMAAALLILEHVNGTGLIKSVGIMVVLGVVVAELAAILGIMSYLNVEASIPSAIALGVLLNAMSTALVVLGVVGAFGPYALAGIGLLATFITAMGGLIIGIGALTDKFPQLEQFLNKGIPVLNLIAYAIGAFFGNIVKGLADSVLSIIPNIGIALSLFMNNLQGFITGAKSINGDVLKGVGILAASIVALSIANFVNSVTSLLSLKGLPIFGLQLSAFMLAAHGFIAGANKIKPGSMEGVKTLSEAILALTGASLLNGISRFLSFGGDNSIDTFASQLPVLGKGLRHFLKALGPVDPEAVERASVAANIIKKLADAASKIPNEGGLWGALFGENSLIAFGEQLPKLAHYLNGFIVKMKDVDDAGIKKAEVAGTIIEKLAEAAKNIPNDGGLWGSLFGENSIASFGAQLPGFAKNLNLFVAALTDFDESKIGVVDTACGVITSLANAASNIPGADMMQVIFGENGFATFSSELPGLGTNLNQFIANLGTLDEDAINSVNAIRWLVSSISSLSNFEEPKDIEKLGDNIKKFSKDMVKVVENFGKIEDSSIETVKNKLTAIKTCMSSITSEDGKAVKSFGDELKNLAETGVSKFIKAFTGETTMKNIENAGSKMVEYLLNGVFIKVDDDTVTTKSQEVGLEASEAMGSKTVYDDAVESGEYVAKGFVAGMAEGKDSAYQAGVSLYNQAEAGIRDAGRIESPSKAAYALGEFVGQGFINAMHDYDARTYKAGYEIADSARKGLSKCVSKITDIINNDIDAQPTIRPVLDLSAVEAGVGSIGTMFGSRATLGVSANIGAITSSMSNRQNGNADVVSAINKLRKDLGNVGGTTNIIDGITYSDGTEVSDAIGTLVRAARIERRV